MPGSDGRSDRGQRRINWVIYRAAPEGTHFDDPASMPPGSVSETLATALDELLEAQFPPYWAEVVRRTDPGFSSVQPIYDHAIPRYVAGRALLIGDAATITRPHTASGATKALQDALTLERVCRDHASLDAALTLYDQERCGAGNALVELGRRLGQTQVEQTPDWTSMTADDFDTWIRTALAGQPLYHYGNVPDRDGVRVPA
jgi:2-polyprenyl-6-methoxyphenol hydroxylase-like FAD-dependent oxidoreductase